MRACTAQTLTRQRGGLQDGGVHRRRSGSHPTSDFRLCVIAGPCFPPAPSCGCARRVGVTLRFRPQLRALNACRRTFDNRVFGLVCVRKENPRARRCAEAGAGG